MWDDSMTYQEPLGSLISHPRPVHSECHTRSNVVVRSGHLGVVQERDCVRNRTGHEYQSMRYQGEQHTVISRIECEVVVETESNISCDDLVCQRVRAVRRLESTAYDVGVSNVYDMFDTVRLRITDSCAYISAILSDKVPYAP